MKYEEIEGDLILLARQGKFEVIAHGCNCQCVQGAGIAKQMVEEFNTDHFDMEKPHKKGDFNKLGCIDFEELHYEDNYWKRYPEDSTKVSIFVVNAYTQFMYGTNHEDGVLKPLDYEALTLCLRKINHIFKGKHIGLPLIGCHLAGGVWNYTELKTPFERYPFENFIQKDVKTIIKEELKDMNVTVVHYKPN